MEVLMVFFFVIGATAIVRGAALLSGPAGWISFGVFCLVAAAWPLRRGK